MRYRQATVVGLGVGLLLAIAVATIDPIISWRVSAGVPICPNSACDRAAQFGGNAERAQVWIAFVVGFAAAFGWFLERPKAALLAVSGGALLALAVMTIDASLAGRLFFQQAPFPCWGCAEARRLFRGMFEGTDVGIAFVVGYAAALIWFLRGHRRLNGA